MVPSGRAALTIALVGLLGSECMAGATELSSPPDRGKALYERYCAVCHGIDGKADTPIARLLKPAPRNFTDPVDIARVTVDRMYQSIAQGRPGTAMAGWKQILSETEIGDVIDYVRSFAPTRDTSTRSSAQISLEVGKRIYDRECAYCHGRQGRADTPAAKVLEPSPRNFSDPVAMARVDDGRMYMAIYRGRPGTAMGGRGEQLSPSEIIDVMRYIRTLVQPSPGTTPAQVDMLVGERIFVQYCAPCHGTAGDARTPLAEHLAPKPRDFTDVATMRTTDDRRLTNSILHGVQGTAMASWDGVLNQEDVRRVLLYIRTRFAGA